MLIRIIMGLIGVAIGFFMVWKSDKFVENVGSLEWAEKFFGPRRSSSGYKVIGIIIILLSFIVMTNMIGGLIMFALGPLFRGGATPQ